MIKLENPIDTSDAKRRGIDSRLSRVFISKPFTNKHEGLLVRLLTSNKDYFVYLINLFDKVQSIKGNFQVLSPNKSNPDTFLRFENREEALSCVRNTNCEIALLFSCDNLEAESILKELNSTRMFKYSNLQPDAIIFNHADFLKVVYSYSQTTDVIEGILFGVEAVKIVKDFQNNER